MIKVVLLQSVQLDNANPNSKPAACMALEWQFTSRPDQLISVYFKELHDDGPAILPV